MVFQINELSQLRYQRKEKEEDDVQASTRIKKKVHCSRNFGELLKWKPKGSMYYMLKYDNYVWSIPVEPVIYTCITNVS